MRGLIAGVVDQRRKRGTDEEDDLVHDARSFRAMRNNGARRAP